MESRPLRSPAVSSVPASQPIRFKYRSRVASLKMQQNQSSTQEYVIREAEIHEQPLLVSFLQQHFFPYEPLLSTYLQSAKVNETEMRRMNEELQRMHEALIARLPCCLVAVHRESQKIVGINLLDIEVRKTMRNGSDCCENSKPKSKLLAEWFSGVLDAAEKRIDFFEKFPGVESVLKIVIVSVDRNHAKRGLATSLLNEALSYARTRGIKIVGGIFTSPYSRRAAEKVGFQTYADIDARSFIDSSGKSIYAEPHVLSVMAIQFP